MLRSARLFIAASLLLAVAAPVHAADRTYDLRGPAPKAGDTVREEMIMEMRDGTMTMSMAGMEFRGRMRMRGRKVTETTILEHDGKKATKIQYNFVHDVDDQAVEMMGQRETNRNEGALHEKVVIGTLEEDKWTFKLKEGEPNPEQSRKLNEMAEQHEKGFSELYPERGVRVGESWEITGPELRKFLDDPNVSGKAKFTLVEVNEEDGEEIAKVSVSLEAAGKADDDEELEMRITLEGAIERSLRTHLDRNVELQGTMVVEGESAEPGAPPMKMNMTGPVVLRVRETQP